MLLCSTLLGLFLQWLSLRLGVVTGRHLAQLCRVEYGRFTRYVLFIMIELAIIGSDIQEVIGSAIAINILFGLPLWAGVLITAADTFTFLFLHAFGVRKLEAFFAALILCMCVCFFADFGIDPPSASGIASGFLPFMRRYAVFQAAGLVGSIIMPHNLYLHSALVQSRPLDHSSSAAVREAVYYFTIEAAVALAVSFLINLSVVSVFANAFFDAQCAELGQALVDGQCDAGVGLSNAGDALQTALGSAAQVVWAIGLLASGQSSTMTGVTTGQFVVTGFFSLSWQPWKQMMVTRSIAIIPALIVGVSAAENKTVLDFLNECINVFMSYQLPFAVLPLLHLTSSQRLMGAFANSLWMRAVGWLAGLLLVPLNISIVFHLLTEGEASAAIVAVFAVISVLYAIFLVFLMQDELREARAWLRKQRKGGAENGLIDASQPFAVSADGVSDAQL